jgi:hypothetical protein
MNEDELVFGAVLEAPDAQAAEVLLARPSKAVMAVAFVLEHMHALSILDGLPYQRFAVNANIRS